MLNIDKRHIDSAIDSALRNDQLTPDGESRARKSIEGYIATFAEANRAELEAYTEQAIEEMYKLNAE